MIEGFEREPMIKQPWHPPYYQQRCEEAGLEQGDGPAHVGARDLRPRADPAGHLQARRARSSRATASRIRQHVAALAARATWTASPRSTTRPGARTGASSPYSKDDLDAYAQELQLVFDPQLVHGRRDRRGRDGRRSRSRCPTSTRCCKKMNGRLLPLGWWHFLRKAQDDRSRARRLPRRQARRTSTPGVAAALYVEHFDTADRDAAEVGRDGLDPRDQPQHEPRDGGDGRPDRAALPRLRADLALRIRAP